MVHTKPTVEPIPLDFYNSNYLMNFVKFEYNASYQQHYQFWNILKDNIFFLLFYQNSIL